MSTVLELRVGTSRMVLRGHDHFWRVIRQTGRDGKTFTVPDIDRAGNAASKRAAADFVKRLEAAGIAEAAGWRGSGRYRQRLYRLLSRPLETPIVNRLGKKGLQGRGQQQMWNILRGPQGLAGVTHEDLVLLASTDQVQIAPWTAKSYLSHLYRAGYLIELVPARPRHAGRYRLKRSMNTGPNAPRVLRTKLVYDANDQRVLPDPLIAEEVGS